MKNLLILFSCTLLASSVLCISKARAQDVAANTNPAIEALNNSVTFYMSFDLPTLTADMSSGVGEPIDTKIKPNLKPGLFESAELPEQTISYAADKNLDLSRTGSLALWIKPFDWQRDTTPYLTFANIDDHGHFIALMRMGNPVNREKIYAYAKAGKDSIVLTVDNSLNWKDNQWHLLVVNWRPDSIDFSIDGAPVKNQHLASWATANGAPGTLNITKASPTQPWLTDEVIVLDRPLEQKEIEAMWEEGQKRNK